MTFDDEFAILKTDSEEEVKVRLRYMTNFKPMEIILIYGANHSEIGIWRLDDDGLLTMCFAPPGKVRPREFATDAKNRYKLWELKRE